MESDCSPCSKWTNASLCLSCCFLLILSTPTGSKVSFPFEQPIDSLLLPGLYLVLEGPTEDVALQAVFQQTAGDIARALTNRAFYVHGIHGRVRTREWRRLSRAAQTDFHLLLAGHPADNPLIDEYILPLAVTILPERLFIEDRLYEGKSLTLIVRTNNLANPRRQTVLVTGTSPAGILANLSDMQTMEAGTYRLREGEVLLEEGLVRDRLLPVSEVELSWQTLVSPPFRLQFQPDDPPSPARVEMSKALFEKLKERFEKEGIAVSSHVQLPFRLYPSASAFRWTTGQEGDIFFDRLTGMLHLVYSPSSLSHEAEGLAQMLLHQRIGVIDREIFRLGCPLALIGELNGQSPHHWASRLSSFARKKQRLEFLFEDESFEQEEPLLRRAIAASFCRFLLDRGGAEVLSELVRLDPTESIEEVLSTTLGEPFFQLKRDWEQLLSSYRPRKGLAQPPKLETIPSDLQPIVTAINRREHDEARRRLEFFLQERPAHPDASVLLAEVGFREGNHEEAIAAAETALGQAKNPSTTAKLRLNLGRSFALQEQMERAQLELRLAHEEAEDESTRAKIAFWSDFVDLEQVSREAFIGKAADLFGQGQQIKAINRIRTILTQDPLDQQAHLALAYFYGRINYEPITALIGIPVVFREEMRRALAAAKTEEQKLAALFVQLQMWERSYLVSEQMSEFAFRGARYQRCRTALELVKVIDQILAISALDKAVQREARAKRYQLRAVFHPLRSAGQHHPTAPCRSLYRELFLKH